MKDKKACCNPNCNYSKPGELLDIKSFFKASRRSDGLDNYCKGCRIDKNRESFLRDPERVSRWHFGTRGHRPETIEKQHGKKYAWQKADNAAMRTRKVDRRRRLRTEEERKKLSKALKGNANAAGAHHPTREQSPEEKYKRKLAMLSYHSKKRRREGKVTRAVKGIGPRQKAVPRVFDYKTGKWRKDPGTRRVNGE